VSRVLAPPSHLAIAEVQIAADPCVRNADWLAHEDVALGRLPDAKPGDPLVSTTACQ
jgi:hypothetical protein